MEAGTGIGLVVSVSAQAPERLQTIYCGAAYHWSERWLATAAAVRRLHRQRPGHLMARPPSEYKVSSVSIFIEFDRPIRFVPRHLRPPHRDPRHLAWSGSHSLCPPRPPCSPCFLFSCSSSFWIWTLLLALGVSKATWHSHTTAWRRNAEINGTSEG